MAHKLKNDEKYGSFADYKLGEHEQNHYHVLLENDHYSNKGERLSRPYVGRFAQAMWKQMNDKQHPAFQDFSVHILHDPTVKEPAPKEEKPTDQEEDEGLTIPEIKKQLDEFGVDYTANERKGSLVEKLEEAQKQAEG